MLLSVEGGHITAVFYISKAYTRLCMGTGEYAASLSDASGTNDAPYMVGNPAEGYVPHLYTFPVNALNEPIVFAAFSAGNRSVADSKWYTRTVIFTPTEDVMGAIQSGVNDSDPELEPSPERKESDQDGNWSQEQGGDQHGVDESGNSDSVGEETDLASYAGTAASSDMSDLRVGEWFMESATGTFPGTNTLYIDYTIKRGLMSGYKDSSGKVTAFGPHDPLSRAQTATILYRLANPDSLATTDPARYEDNVSDLSDVDSGKYYTAAVNWCVTNGVITGCTDAAGNPTGFGPDDDVTREQLATMICRYCTTYAGQPEASAAISSFSDYARISDWAQAGVAYCVANGIVGGYSDGSGRFGPGDKAERCQMAKIIAVTARILE